MYFFAVIQVPSRPGRPVVKSIVGRKVTIEWAAPEYDGGARIIYYVIHYGAMDDSDIKSMVKLRVTGRKTVYTIIKCIQLNKQYKFAVAAVNKEAMGPLSQFSECVNTPCRSGRYDTCKFHMLNVPKNLYYRTEPKFRITHIVSCNCQYFELRVYVFIYFLFVKL